MEEYSPGKARALYQLLVAPAEGDIRAKSVVYIAPDDLLYKLPFETLLTAPFQPPPAVGSVIGRSLADAPFWVASHSIAYLPSLSVLRSLRTLAKAEVRGRSPLLAFADPVFEAASSSETGRAGDRTVAARSLRLQKLRAGNALDGGALPRLPDTRDEALFVARVLGASAEHDVFLREKATEYNVKRLPLKRYRNLLFATHGLLAGEFGPEAQPSLALSFVNDPENDGLLEMGEILGLDLNADLVALSACNTAGGGGREDRGEGFAGLTRSFMYAGARSLMVTQWSVESSSARTLVQNAFSNVGQYPIGKALSAAKRAMIRGGGTVDISNRVSVSLAHPFFWGPYVLVGETR